MQAERSLERRREENYISVKGTKLRSWKVNALRLPSSLMRTRVNFGSIRHNETSTVFSKMIIMTNVRQGIENMLHNIPIYMLEIIKKQVVFEVV